MKQIHTIQTKKKLRRNQRHTQTKQNTTTRKLKKTQELFATRFMTTNAKKKQKKTNKAKQHKPI